MQSASADTAATYPVGVIARLLMLTDRHVQQLSADGVIPKAERGRYLLAPAVQGYIRYLKERSIGADMPSDTNVGTLKARILSARARLAEADADQREGRLLDRGEVDLAWQTIVLNMRAKLLALPTRAAPQLVGVTSTLEAASLLEVLIGEALNELADQPIEAIAPDRDVGPDRSGAVSDSELETSAEEDDL